MSEYPLRPLKEIVGHPSNPKDHDIGETVVSIQRFGFLDPIVYNVRTNRLLSGHGRVEALRQMKLNNYPRPRNVERLSNGDWGVPNFEVDVEEEEEEAVLIALNRLVERGGWNEVRLADVMSDLAARGEEMLKGTGFDMDDVDALLKKVGFAKSQDESSEENVDDEYNVTYAIVVECRDEHEQSDLLTEFYNRGMRCRSLIS